LANAGVDCLLLDLDQPTVTRLFEAMLKARPPALFSPSTAGRLETGTFATHLSRLAEADWIIEAIVENYEAKRSLLPQVDRHRQHLWAADRLARRGTLTRFPVPLDGGAFLQPAAPDAARRADPDARNA